MKLAEALILRADCQKRIAQLQQRLMRSAKVQDGEQAPENPQELLAELDAAIVELTQLIQRINKTNAVTSLQEQTLSDALAERDTLQTKRNIYSRLIEAAAIQPIRYSQSEVRFVSTVNIAELQRQVDALARDYRVLDSAIQELNWQADLLEA
jgi:uncharacterized coiled-coil DUF342 family protein